LSRTGENTKGKAGEESPAGIQGRDKQSGKEEDLMATTVFLDRENEGKWF